MQLFIDSADLGEIREAASWGIVDGVTTNPSLIAATGRGLFKVIEEICDVVDGPISAECIETAAERMIPEAREIAKIHRNIVVKVPLTVEGLKTVKAVAKDGIRTLCFSATQGLLAAKVGASFISPFIGRLDDISAEGRDCIRDLVDMYDRYGFGTRVLAASVRHPRHVLDAARAGAHAATVPFKVLQQLFNHPLTDLGLEKFLNDWAKVAKV
jgi:transaldolase